MNAAWWVWARYQWRRRRLAAWLIALLFGLALAVVLAASAGARRTQTAFPRMVEATAAADLLVNPDAGVDSELDFDAVAAQPNVADTGLAAGMFLVPEAPGGGPDFDLPVPTFLLVDFAEDAGPDPVAGVEARYRERGGTFLGLQRPGDITAFAGVLRIPVLLAGMLSILGLGVLAHGLWIGVRSHRRGLAVLKSIGFTRRQVRSVVEWQAATLVVAAMLFAVPLGVAGGRLAWQVLADRLGVPADPVLPLASVALVVVGTLVAAHLIGAWPARRASRARVASELRAE